VPEAERPLVPIGTRAGLCRPSSGYPVFGSCFPDAPREFANPLWPRVFETDEVKASWPGRRRCALQRCGCSAFPESEIAKIMRNEDEGLRLPESRSTHDLPCPGRFEISTSAIPPRTRPAATAEVRSARRLRRAPPRPSSSASTGRRSTRRWRSCSPAPAVAGAESARRPAGGADHDEPRWRRPIWLRSVVLLLERGQFGAARASSFRC